jgi:flavin reductase (DIM6/NTAB) family NADH-FMN oxidoreductase RutF
VVTADELRDVLRRQPTGISVITVDSAGGRLGLTVGTLVSLSLAPPLVGVAVNRHAAMHELLRGAACFAFSLLGGDQTAVAQHFARGVPPIAMWHGVSWHAGATGAPLLDGALGWIECTLAAEHETGDHTLFVGEVVSVERGAAGPALVYVDRRYVTHT